VLSLRPRIPDIQNIEEVRITSFHQAVRLHTTRPQSTEEAQYSLPWAVACALHRGTVDQTSVTDDLDNNEVIQLAGKIRLCESEELSSYFPAKRYATATIRLTDGQELISERFQARGTPGNPIDKTELITKFYELVPPDLASSARHLEHIINTLPDRPVTDLLTSLNQAILHSDRQENRSSHATET
jgi:2-methylcitrate dehydratase PrpD